MRQLILILAFTLTYTMSFAQWEQVSSLPASFQTHHSYAFSLNGKGYIVAGVANNGYRKDFYEYDASADQWTKLQDYPGPPRGFGIGDVWNGKAYLGFGVNNSGELNDLWSFDPATNTWEQLASCPCAARLHPAFVANDGKIYVGMGNNNTSGNLNDWWEYDIDSNTWSQKPNFPAAPRHHPFQFSAGGTAYAGFGHGDGFISNEWYKFDGSTWTQVASIPDEGRVAGTQFSHGGKGYILSGDGQNHSSMVLGEFWTYDPDLDTWTELTPHPGNSRWAPSSFVLNNEVYIINGQSSQIYQSNIYKFALSPPLSTPELEGENDQLVVYPNPFQDELNLQFKDLKINIEDYQIKIYNSAAQLLFETKYQPQMDLSFLPSGLLWFELSNQEKTYRKLISKY